MLKRTLTILLLLAVCVPASYAIERKKVAKEPEIVTQTVTVYDTVRVVVTDTVKIVVKEVVKPAPRIDTLTVTQSPKEIDSLAAVWRKLLLAQADKKYFERYSSTTDKEAKMPKDSLYKKRLQDMVSPVPLPYNALVRNYIDGYFSGKWSNMPQTLAIARYYFPILEEELHAAGLPLELRYLAVVESNLSIRAGSRAGAMGLWQIMPSTGKGVGLEINSLVDERCDVVKSTKAACKFLKYLYKVYGDWTLAIAAYNCGAGNVNKAMASAGPNAKTFWDIYDHLPNETRQYVPKFIGAAYAFTYYKAHNVTPNQTPDYIVTDTVTIRRVLHLGQVASTLKIPIETLRDLNPQYKLDIIPATRKSYSLRLPMHYMSEFAKREKEIYSKEKAYLKEYLDPANIEKKRAEEILTKPAAKPAAKPATTTPQSYTYIIQDGDTLGHIAIRNKCSVEELKKWNNLTSDAIRAGAKLLIKRPKPKTEPTKK